MGELERRIQAGANLHVEKSRETLSWTVTVDDGGPTRPTWAMPWRVAYDVREISTERGGRVNHEKLLVLELGLTFAPLTVEDVRELERRFPGYTQRGRHRPQLSIVRTLAPVQAQQERVYEAMRREEAGRRVLEELNAGLGGPSPRAAGAAGSRADEVDTPVERPVLQPQSVCSTVPKERVMRRRLLL